MWVRSLGKEDLLEKEMATYSSVLAWTIPRIEGYSLGAHTKLDAIELTHTHTQGLINNHERSQSSTWPQMYTQMLTSSTPIPTWTFSKLMIIMHKGALPQIIMHTN